jgi:AraC family transcriptional regulator
MQFNVVTGPSRAVIPYQQGLDTRSPIVRSLRAEDLLVVEVDRLLADVRAAVNYDLDVATEAAGRLTAILANRLQQASRPIRGGLAPWQKRKIQAYVEDRLEGSILVGDLAKVVSLSISYFSRSFKQSFGEAPHTYIVKTRIERAKTMMTTTRESLSQIALACGLLDQAHLCKCFRQVTGTTPGAWRRAHATGP